MVKNARRAVELPEVQEAMKMLAKHGLGVFMPHQHHETEGGFQPLPSGVVQVEENFEVSFRPLTDELLEGATVVGWRWDERAQASAVCLMCMDSQKGHAKMPH